MAKPSVFMVFAGTMIFFPNSINRLYFFPVKFFWIFCQHLKYPLSTFWHVSSPHLVTANPSEVSNMNACVPSATRSAFSFFSDHA